MKLKDKKVLVTGAGGFIGSHLVKELKKRKIFFDVFLYEKGWDIRNLAQVMKLPKADLVIHLAAKVSVTQSLKKPQETFETNVLGTLNILEYCRLHKARIIFPSSVVVYGKPVYLPIDEEHRLEANNPYALSKILAEDLCQRYCRLFKIKAVVLRLFNVYGPGQSEEAVIPRMITDLLRKKKIVVNSGTVGRDFVFVDDVVKAILAAMEFKGDGYQVFNIGSGKSFQIGKVAEMIKKISGIGGVSFVDRGIKRPGEVRKVAAGIKKTKKYLNWQSKISLKEGLLKTYQYYRKQ